MKKFLPIILIAIVVIGGAIGFVSLKQQNSTPSQTESVPDLPDDQRPTVSLVPTQDGHYLSLKIEQINKVKDASSLDYELIWKAKNEGNLTTQGTSGTIKIAGMSSYNKDILLGSESSGKFRYDQGVETGSLTIRFRDKNGKLIGKLSSDFHLQTNTLDLSSVDGSFKYTLSKDQPNAWYVTMKSFNKPNSTDVVTYQDGWAVYSSSKK